MNTTTVIVLRKQPYEENGLLLYGVSPDYGRVSLVARGANKITARQTPVADVFRELETVYEPGKNSELGSVRELSLLTDFSKVAEDTRNFQFAGRIGSFLLRNASPELPLPFSYDALRNVLIQLILPPETDGRWTMLEAAVALKMTYLYENGLLPESEEQRQAEFVEKVIAAAIEGTALPSGGQDYYKKLNAWCDQLIAYHGLSK